MTSPTDILVTGLAWTTPLGDSLDGVWSRLLAGDSGLTEAPSEFPLRTSVAGIVPEVAWDLSPVERQVELAARTLAAACADAAVDPADPDLRIVLGTSYGPHVDGAAAPLDAWAGAATERLGHRRAPICVGTACSAGSDSVLVAAELIRSGAAGVCLAGGVDVVTNAKRLGHSALGTMSPDTLRAFDERHDGMIPGEGAAVLVLESAESARSRSARAYAALRGAASANDAAGLTIPDPSGDSVVASVERCLAVSGKTAADIAVISAHATGTPLNDAVETLSLRRLFGAQKTGPLVFATKGALGHSLGATGAIEAVSVVLALDGGMVPPISGLTQPVADFPLPLAADRAREFAGDVGLSLTIGFGGFNTCLLFERTG